MSINANKKQYSLSILLQILITSLLFCIIAFIWRGNPLKIFQFNTTSFSILLRNIYYLLFFTLIFSFSRTVGLRCLFLFFLLGATVVAGTSIALQKLVLYMNFPYSEYLGSWSRTSSVYHACITGPIVEEVIKMAPVAIYSIVAIFRGTLRGYSVSDWLLLALAVGLGFSLAEDFMRLSTPMGVYLGSYDWSWPSNIYDFFVPLWKSKGQFILLGEKMSFLYGSHGLLTAVIGLTFGIAIRGSKGNVIRRFAIYLLPFIVLLWAILDHGLANLSLGSIRRNAQEHMLAKFLFSISIGGRAYLFVGLAAIYGLTLYEFLVLRASTIKEWFGILRCDLSFIYHLLGNIITRKEILNIKGIKPRLIFICLYVWGSINLLLEFAISRFTIARVKHYFFWKDRYRGISEAQ